MTLFGSDPQYREKAAMWRVFSLLPLNASLAGGCVFGWYAVNIPMDLGTGGTFTSDIDIIARLQEFPPSKNWFYKTWEVKVSLLCRNGIGRSLKAGKTARTLTQLRAYRDYGSPAVSLLEIYICESGFMLGNAFPPEVIREPVAAKIGELGREGFGYQLLPFEHGKDGDIDVGLLAYRDAMNPLQTTNNLWPARVTETRQPFSRLVGEIDDFYKKPRTHSLNALRHRVVFCRACRSLQAINMKEEHLCPGCNSDLIEQS